MKAITIRPKKQKNPDYSEADKRKAKQQCLPYRVKPTVPLPVGTVIDHPEAWMLVNHGDAVPADEECREAAGMTEDELVDVIAKQELLSQGRSTGVPEYDGPRKVSAVQLPEEWSHLKERIQDAIQEKQDRIDQMHNTAKQADAEEKAAEKTVFVIDASDLPPDVDELPPETE